MKISIDLTDLYGRMLTTGKIQKTKLKENKAGYTATPVAGGWAGAIFEVNGASEQE